MSQSKIEETPNCFTCEHLTCEVSLYYCSNHQSFIDDPLIKDLTRDACFTDFCEDYKEAALSE